MWERCWAVARVVLKLSDEEFFALTPRQYHILLDQHKHEEQKAELLAGIISSTVANFSMCKLKRSMRATDFMPSMADAPKPRPKRVRKPTAQQLADKFRAVFGGLWAK